MTAFSSLHDLYKAFPNDLACYSYLENLRWNGSVVCPHCNSGNSYKLKNGKEFRCSNKECKKTFSTLSGTIFECSRIPLQKWFLAIYIATSHKKGISSLQLSRDLGITQKSAWYVLHRVREMLKAKSPIMLSGIVEVDESYVGGKESNKHQSYTETKARKTQTGRTANKKSVVAGILQRDGKVVNKVVVNASSRYLLPVLNKHIKKGSTMVSDDWRPYRALPKHGFNHEYVNHSAKEYVRGNFHTNGIEGYWSQLKRGIIGIYHQVSKKHLHRYCDEFTYRYNTRKETESQRFESAIKESIGVRIKYHQLIEKFDTRIKLNVDQKWRDLY